MIILYVIVWGLQNNMIDVEGLSLPELPKINSLSERYGTESLSERLTEKTITTTGTTTTKLSFCDNIDKHFKGEYEKEYRGKDICYFNDETTVCTPYKHSHNC